LFRQIPREQLEVQGDIYCEWTELVLESQRPSMSFGEAAARYVASIQPVPEADEQIVQGGIIYDGNGEPIDDYFFEEARSAQTAELWRIQQERNDWNIANGDGRANDVHVTYTENPSDSNLSYEQALAYERQRQEVLDRELAQRLQAEDELPVLLDYNMTERHREEQEQSDRKLAQLLIAEGGFSTYIEATIPRTRAQTTKEEQQEFDRALAESIATEDDNNLTKSIANGSTSGHSIECARYKAAKRKARDDSIG
jgi:hypothetical protein